MSHADNSQHLIDAARRRSHDTHTRAHAALDTWDPALPLSVTALARAAGVSRAWLYTDPTARERINALAGPQPIATAVPRPPTAASETSLLRRLELAHGTQRRLRQENTDLRRDLAVALGALRHRHDPDPAPAPAAAPETVRPRR